MLFACAFPLPAAAQTLSINNDIQTYATLSNTSVTMAGKSELRITGSGDPIPGCVINLSSADAWVVMANVVPSQVVSTFLSRIQVNGAAAVVDSNVRVVQHGMGAVVIPQGPAFAPMEVFDGKYFTGASRSLRCYVAYNDALLGSFKTAISSFRLKRGYTATVAQNENGTGISRNYVAQDGDLEVGLLPSALDNKIRFIRIFPWRWTGKKGIAGNIVSGLNVRWDYNWNLDRNSTRDVEYVPIRQLRWWPGLDQNWQTRGANHLLGYNEPDQANQANIAVEDAIWSWPDLLSSGLRLGAPAVSDGGLNWLYSFIDQADAAGLRVDFVPVHYYRSFSNAADPDGAATQFYNFLKGVHDRVKRPLWVTEWNNGANWTSGPDPTFAQQQATVAKMIAMLDNTPFVERYAIYNWVEDVRRVKWDDGSLTDAGVAYRDKVSPLSYVQELPGVGISSAAHYAFNNDLRDSMANGNDAMAIGAPTFVTGKYNQAVALDGSTDYLQVSPDLGDSTDFSFAGWIKWDGGNSWQRVFDFGESTDSYMFLTPRSAGTTGNLRFAIKVGGGSEQVLNAAPLTQGVWTHVAVTISGNTGKLFVNGALAATNTGMSYNPADIGTNLNYVGKSQFPADPLFDGQLDDLRFFATALTDSQIATIAGNTPPQFTANPIVATSATSGARYTGALTANVSGGSGALTFGKVSGPAWLSVAANGSLVGYPGSADRGLNRFLLRVTDANGAGDTVSMEITVVQTPGLVARYAFDGTCDASVGGANGVASGSPVYLPGRQGSAIDLNGTNSYVTLPAGVGSEAEITIAVWFWRDSASDWQRVFDFGSGTSEYMFLTAKSNANTIRFGIKNGGAEQALNSPALPTGQWVHVAVTLGANIGRLYVNGTLADTQTITIKPTDFAHDFNYVGKSQFADPLFDGRIDEVLIFNEVLNASQIAALVNRRAPSFNSDPVNEPAAIVGQAYEQTIAGSASDPDAGSILTYEKVSGPEWLAASANGRISGVPPAGDTGVNRFVVRVTDETLLAEDASLTISLSATDLVARYQFDGNMVDDAGGGVGVASGGPGFVAGVFNKAIRLDGADDYVRLPAGVVSGLSDITIAARVRWDGGANWQRVFDFGNNTTQYMHLTANAGSAVRFAITTSGFNGEQRLNAAPLPVGEWCHVAVTLIGNTATLYVGGVAVASNAAMTINPSDFAPSINYIGKSQTSADPLFNGLIDDFRIYNRGLSALEIQALANSPAAVGVSDSSYAAWSAGTSFPDGLSGAQADPDEDGWINAWEYLLGSDPMISSGSSSPHVQVFSAAELGLAGDKSYLTLQARVKKRHLGATLVPEAASSVEGLALPTAASQAHPIGVPIADGEFEILTFYYDVAIEDSPTGAGAMRLRLNLD